MHLDTVHHNDVIGDLGDAGTKAHHDVSATLDGDAGAAVQAQCIFHDCLAHSPPKLAHVSGCALRGPGS